MAISLVQNSDKGVVGKYKIEHYPYQWLISDFPSMQINNFSGENMQLKMLS